MDKIEFQKQLDLKMELLNDFEKFHDYFEKYYLYYLQRSLRRYQYAGTDRLTPSGSRMDPEQIILDIELQLFSHALPLYGTRDISECGYLYSYLFQALKYLIYTFLDRVIAVKQRHNFRMSSFDEINEFRSEEDQLDIEEKRSPIDREKLDAYIQDLFKTLTPLEAKVLKSILSYADGKLNLPSTQISKETHITIKQLDNCIQRIRYKAFSLAEKYFADPELLPYNFRQRLAYWKKLRTKAGYHKPKRKKK